MRALCVREGMRVGVWVCVGVLVGVWVRTYVRMYGCAPKAPGPVIRHCSCERKLAKDMYVNVHSCYLRRSQTGPGLVYF